MRSALVFGGSGQIGEPVIARLLADGWQVQAVSRQPRGQRAGLRWLRGEFDGFEEPLPVQVDAVFSLGPLDRFSLWYERSSLTAARVIAFGSTSIDTKHASADAGERDLAARLLAGETRVLQAARARGAQATLLRPTLVYGAGRDQTLSRIAALARRTGFFVLPAGACGRRQPVHVDDLAAAALAVIDRMQCAGNSYALPGGETLTYRDMIARTLQALQPPARLLEAPAPLFRAALWLARRTGRMGGLSNAAVARMREDLVFDAAPAVRDFGYAPRPFQPDARALGQGDAP
ncbi:NAD-dependent epimerase/dehydratase family protein [Pseudoxanthomonas wuyuanensis]|uniref:Nucleoside-diphosphate-sugar epimerase n=1 Tax=Pseudoxanthomonas wuyuanensis TaxID=1073196 RepID=A0A286D6R5_9GAMM|nr:NAD-dependent epimerase/dehydratase family protein [Pseudoxanthomonas wuyuanensis]KAF1719104.1 nucleoside-diphosphate sugar epimerase [Pseudoxanthomonas wuyuanensis]SOD54352.1 Nucleoside-diphosphate-sugar epimerase [Pseudoxanthomonas wuyuanensis]